MKQVLIRNGRAVIQEMPSPICGDGEILVRTWFSLISSGTERAILDSSAPPSVGLVWTRRARKAAEAARMVTDLGVKDAQEAIRARLEGESSVAGYSLSGIVLEVGSAVRDIVPGQRVACAGASSAHHAEIVAVPRNLVAPIPSGLAMEHAAAVTLGAIALQGTRQADLRLGEIACVTGLGLLGLISVALLRASGCRVFGIDVDSGRVERGRALGLDLALMPGRDDVERAVDHATAGNGCDAVIVTAASRSSDLIRQAVRLVRQRGRVVVVGDVGMELDRGPLYMKEAELRISRSYGPGRYDPSYEQEGQDYPYGYVRWTENRNLEQFLRLAASGAVALDGILDRILPLDEAEEAYRAISDSRPEDRPLAVVLRHPAADDEPGRQPSLARRIEVVKRSRAGRGLAVALVGPGAFASEVHLPNLAALGPLAHLRTVVGRTANPTREAARRWAASIAATDLDEALQDPGIDLVLISTRHDLHARQAARSLDAGKAVFLEKPAAINLAELAGLEDALRRSARPFAVGFNRRFAPDVLVLKQLLASRRGPMVIDYRVNAGRLPAGHWALGPQGGGRLVGEACHMIDLLRDLVGAPRSEHAIHVLAPPDARGDLPIGDNFVLSCRHEDGSLATLTYLSLGHPAIGKERIEIHWDGKSAVIDDFRSFSVYGVSGVDRSRETADKGHRELLRRFVEHAAGQAPEPIPLLEILEVSRFVLELDREARRPRAAREDS